ncbi:hypothetical protein I6J18_00895 [Peribacillus psychrosaccharolyticus]|uniref:Uncharacterized protein n=1 Tax=Peribacillus psychrosaccharolyticus TaxID=1407 RepID=A0A974S0N2_PERPY|nr:hypothetical protein [Peribacillus psychrosaccharolyticus]MEC2056290.1 hypothetical protein [Peribacillus psychrosaccharolyticus]MED3743692.1 hypothetical protein [Peribacillus psychrosaccharolyticus]QQT00538.1 hypothetical protein I6J18_00895 [Peribacillus psychrosaccharolyticus]
MTLFQTDHKNKAFIITIAGFAGAEGAALFVEGLKKEVSKIDVKAFTLIADGTNMKTFKPEILPILEKSYQLYMSLGFKKVLVVSPASVTPRLQIKRVAKNVHFSGEFIGNLRDALTESAEA